MKREIEIKARVKSLDDIKKKILTLGGKPERKISQIDIYYGEHLLYKKLGYPFMVRVRQEGGKALFTYKGAALKADGIWEEIEFGIDNADKGLKMLRAMGLEKIVKISKKREEFRLNNFGICLDRIEGLGDFIELELISDDEPKKIQKKLVVFMKKLGVSPEKVIKKGYVYLLLEKTNSPFLKYSY